MRSRLRVRPTNLGLVAGIILIYSVTSGVGRDQIAVGLLRGVLAGILVLGVWSALSDMASVRPTSVSLPRRVTLGHELDVGSALGPQRSGVDYGLSLGNEVAVRQEDSRLVIRPHTRGRHGVLVADVSTSGLIGPLRLSRRLFIPLDTPLWVCPEVLDPVPFETSSIWDRDQQTMVVTRAPELTRGVRPMVDGDLIRNAHWPATARRGSIHVREFEQPAAPVVAVVVELCGDPPADDVITGRALGTVVDLLGAGVPVTMHLCRPNGPTEARIDDEDQAARLLAEAVFGWPTAPRSDMPSIRVDSSCVSDAAAGGATP